MPPINTIVVHTLLLPPERQDETVRSQAERLLSKAWLPVEAAIAGRDYLIGAFSAADTMLGHACIMSKRLGIITDEAYPQSERLRRSTDGQARLRQGIFCLRGLALHSPS